MKIIMLSSSFSGGWKFPVEIDETTGKIKLSNQEDNIAESIKIILGTFKGERVMREEFGSEANTFIFETMDSNTLYRLESKIREAIKRWEHSIDNVEVSIDFDKNKQGVLLISVKYIIKDSYKENSIVYPFDILEGIK